jgi:hypothetical protein
MSGFRAPNRFGDNEREDVERQPMTKTEGALPSSLHPATDEKELVDPLLQNGSDRAAAATEHTIEAPRSEGDAFEQGRCVPEGEVAPGPRLPGETTVTTPEHGAQIERAPTFNVLRKPQQVAVSVVVPTFERPAALLRVLASLDAQDCALDFEIVVVDNSPTASSREAVEAHASRHPLRYFHEPTPGVSAARNRGVGAARGDLIAFIDDDEEADADWLAQLVRCREAYDADAVFGWVEAVLEDGAAVHGKLFATAISRRFVWPSGEVPTALVAKLGTGNSLFHRRVLGNMPFDLVFGMSGGEDSALIRRIVNDGGRLVWCREAKVVEHVPVARTTLRAILERRFSSGQLRTRQHLTGAHPSRSTSAFIVLAGAVQVCVALPLALLAAPLAPGFAVRMLAQAAAGAGKVLFMEPFFIQRYRRSSAPASASQQATVSKRRRVAA